MDLLQGVNAFVFGLHLSTTFRIVKKDGGRTILENATLKMDLMRFTVLWVLAVEINAFVEGFVVHPDTVESLFAIRLA